MKAKKVLKSLTVFTIIFMFTVLIISSALFARPASCSANCPGGGSVSCDGATCIATDGMGCVGMSGGQITSIDKC